MSSRTQRSAESDLALALGEDAVKRPDLVRTLDNLPDMAKDHRIFLRADRSVPYGEMMNVLELLRAGGYLKVALVALEGVPDADSGAPGQATAPGPKP